MLEKIHMLLFMDNENPSSYFSIKKKKKKKQKIDKHEKYHRNIPKKISGSRRLIARLPCDTLVKLAAIRFPEQSPMHNIWTRDSAVPRVPTRVTLDSNTVKRSRCIFVFSILCACRLYAGRVPAATETFSHTIHGGERTARGPCTVTTTRKEVDIISTYGGSYRWHSMPGGYRRYTRNSLLFFFQSPRRCVRLCVQHTLLAFLRPVWSRAETAVHGD